MKFDRMKKMTFFILMLTIIILDQGSKKYISNNFAIGDSFPIIENIFYITHVNNPGAAFGLLAHQTNFFVILTVFFSLIILFFGWRMKTEHILVRYGLALLMGGALGNLFDRVRTGYVIDFLDFKIWPVFNLADIAIVVGIFMFLFYLRRYYCTGRGN